MAAAVHSGLKWLKSAKIIEVFEWCWSWWCLTASWHNSIMLLSHHIDLKKPRKQDLYCTRYKKRCRTHCGSSGSLWFEMVKISQNHGSLLMMLIIIILYCMPGWLANAHVTSYWLKNPSEQDLYCTGYVNRCRTQCDSGSLWLQMIEISQNHWSLLMMLIIMMLDRLLARIINAHVTSSWLEKPL